MKSYESFCRLWREPRSWQASLLGEIWLLVAWLGRARVCFQLGETKIAVDFINPRLRLIPYDEKTENRSRRPCRPWSGTRIGSTELIVKRGRFAHVHADNYFCARDVFIFTTASLLTYNCFTTADSRMHADNTFYAVSADPTNDCAVNGN